MIGQEIAGCNVPRVPLARGEEGLQRQLLIAGQLGVYTANQEWLGSEWSLGRRPQQAINECRVDRLCSSCLFANFCQPRLQYGCRMAGPD